MKPLDQKILDFIARNPDSGRDAIRRAAAPDISETTVWRATKRLVDAGQVDVSGRGPGRAARYQIADPAIVRTRLSIPHHRRRTVSYRHTFIDAYVPGKTWYLPRTDHNRLLADPALSDRLRALPVAISHSSYQPPDDAVTIAEEFDILLHKTSEITDPFEQAFFLLIHIPYLWVLRISTSGHRGSHPTFHC
ncbi:MAG: winged helix-turn-helix domain-containing protein [Rhodobacteraceae bacterium]|nr:winged helix-turn-helix domain-containing protein [Paracoccaceae bacterium]